MKFSRTFFSCTVFNPRIQALIMARILSIVFLVLLLISHSAQAQTLALQIPADLPALAGAWDATIDAAGNIYVSASGDRQVVKLSPIGEELMRVSLPEGGYPTGIDLDNEGNIYVADGGNDCAHKFDSSGNLLATFGSAYEARELAVDGSGHVYLGDSTPSLVHVFTTSGVFIQTLEIENGHYIAALAVDDADNLYVVDGGYRILKFDTALNLLFSFTSGDPGVPDFSASGFDVNASGHIYISNVHSDEIFQLDSTGTLLNRFGGTGSADGDFRTPGGVAIDHAGHIYVTDYLQGRVQKFSSSGGFLVSYGTFGTSNGQFDMPKAVAVDHLGNIYVADWRYRIQKFNSQGEFLLSFTVSDSGLIKDIAVDRDGDGHLYVVDLYVVGSQGFTRVRKFDLNGNLLGTIDFFGAEAVTVDDMGNVYFASWDEIRKYDSEGNLLFSFSDPFTFFGEADIAVDGAGNIYVAAPEIIYNEERVLKFDSTGSLIAIVIEGNGDFDPPFRVDADSEGNLYVAAMRAGISALDPDGNILYTFGERGGGPGEFCKIEDIAVTAPGIIYVADDQNHRVDVFTINTSYLCASHGGDTDSDGICDDDDECPEQDSTGFDADGDGCIDSLGGLSDAIDGLLDIGAIDEAMATSLKQKIENAEKSATKENICAAVNQVEAFKNQVEAQSGKKISDEAADMIIEYANNVIEDLLSQLPPGDTC